MYQTETLYCDNGHYWARQVVRGPKPSLCYKCKREAQRVITPGLGTRRKVSGKLEITDGGKSKEGFAFEKNDCSVRAVAVACGVSYKDAYTFMARNGRRKNKGAYFHSVIARNNNQLFGKTLKSESIEPSKGLKTALLRNPQLRSGTWILHSTHHVSVLKDGVLHDSFDSSRKIIDGAWRVS